MLKEHFNSFFSNFNGEKILLATTRKSNFFIPNHAFAVLRVFDYNGTTLLRIFNPWRRDVFLKSFTENLNEKEYTIYEDNGKGGFTQVKMSNLNKFDGKTFIRYEDFLKNFEKIEVYKSFNSYEVISKRIGFKDSEADFTVKFEVISEEEIFIFFNLINDGEILSPQIQAFEITAFEISPAPFSIDKSSMEYNGMRNSLHKGVRVRKYVAQREFLLRFRARKFNYDVTDHIFLSILGEKNGVFVYENEILVSKKQESCPEKCNKQGICKENVGKCECFENVVFFFLVIFFLK